jgi:hypothetical protein
MSHHPLFIVVCAVRVFVSRCLDNTERKNICKKKIAVLKKTFLQKTKAPST